MFDMVLIALTRLVMNSYEKTVWMIMGIDPFLVAIVIKRKKTTSNHCLSSHLTIWLFGIKEFY